MPAPPRPLLLLALFGLGLACGRALARPGASGRAGHGNGAIIQNAREAIISADAAGTIVLANPAAAAMFGTTVARMQGSALAHYLRLGPGGLAGQARAGRRGSDTRLTGLRGGVPFPLEGSLSSTVAAGHTIHTIMLRDITERQLVQDSLARSHAQLRQLSAALQTIREQERAHIARELHDDLGQLLAALRMDLALLLREDGADDKAASLMRGMEQRLQAAIVSLRRIASNLRPRALDEGGLYFALQGLRADFTSRHGIPAELFADEAQLRLDDAASTAIYRIVQEALTNIARHAGASKVTLHLYRLDGQLLITIRDDGRGIAPADLEKAQSLGLVGMRERVWAMQGEISVSGAEPPGTRIDIALPLPAPPAGDLPA